jgi:NADPH2:quinone reductase
VQVDDVAPPPLGAGQVRVQVHAASVNFPDVLLVANQYQISAPLPFVPGSEFAGVVAELGEGVDAPAVGTRVAGACLVGAFGDEVVVNASALRRVPDNIDDRHAAAFGVAHSTAYHVLRSVAALQAGEELIVLGAGGGVGLAAVQLGAVLGASVTAVASSRDKLDAAAAYGARHLVDHRDADVHDRGLRDALRAALPEGGDVVIDPVGGPLAEPALRSLRWGGRFVTVGYASGEIPKIPLNLVLLKGVHILGFQMIDFMTHAADEMARNDAELLELLTAGRVTPHVGATFGLDDAAAALEYVADGRAIGKVVLEIAR